MDIPRIQKAIFPVAGLGTRFLPATKANPKEMLPVVDKPLIQYAVEEAIEAGITELIFVTNSSKRAIEDHFDSNYELESILAERHQTELLELVHGILPKHVVCVYIRQPNPLGLGHAVLCAKNLIGNEAVAVLLADDMIIEPPQGCLTHMVQHYQRTGNSIIAVEAVTPERLSQYGVVGLTHTGASIDQPQPICAIVEKPQPENAPSNLGVVGRYILTPGIFPCLEWIAAQARQGQGEIQLTDAISRLLETQTIDAYPLTGKRFDCGNKLGYLKATVSYALERPDLSAEFRAFLKTVL